MEKERKRNIVRYVILAILLCLVFILQSTMAVGRPIGNFRPLLLIPMVICIGMFEKETAGAFFGLSAGLLWDTISQDWFGFHALFLMIAGGVCGLMVRYLLRNTFLAGLLLCFLLSFLYGLLYWLLFILLPGGTVQNLVWGIFPRVLMTTAVMPIFYWGHRLLKKWTRVKEDPFA